MDPLDNRMRLGGPGQADASEAWGGSDQPLLTPLRLNPLELPNRIVMAPMTRRRAGRGSVPTGMTADYYRQRAAAGLLVTEATPVEVRGQGSTSIPGLFNDRQEEGWRRVVEAVHGEGGRIFQQLWHAGRVAHPANLPGVEETVAPSPIPPPGRVRTPKGEVRYPVPRALETEEIPEVVDRFRGAARRSARAGFDGVELHGGQGYLVDQFLRDGTNRREDAYGGSIERRTRFLLEVTRALCDVFGAGRVGVQLSPLTDRHGMRDSDPEATFGRAAERLGELGLAYLHVVELDARGKNASVDGEPPVIWRMREAFGSPVMLNGGYDRERGNRAIAEGRADLVSFGRLFLSNPDLPARFARGLPLNAPDPDTFYQGGEDGYLDYPTWAEHQEGAEAPAGLLEGS